MAGPKGRLCYNGNAKFTIAKKEVSGKTKLGFLCGGSGITPAYQVFQNVLSERQTSVKSMNLVFANRTVNDILLKDEIEQMESKSKGKFKKFFSVD